MASSLFLKLQKKELEQITANESAQILHNYDPKLFAQGHLNDISNIDNAGIDYNGCMVYKDCLLQTNIMNNGNVAITSLPISLSNNRDNEIELVNEIIASEIFLGRLPSYSLDRFLGNKFEIFVRANRPNIMLEATPQFYYKTPEALDYSGGSKKAFRQLAKDQQYLNLIPEYVTIDNLEARHIREIDYLTAIWVKHYKALHKSRGTDATVVKDLANAFKGCYDIKLPNQWLILFLRDPKYKDAVIYSLTERINPSYVTLTLGKNHPNYMSAYPDAAKYIYMLETKYWSSLPGMSEEVWFSGGDAGDVKKERNLDDKGKPIDDWDFYKSDSYIYKNSLAYHKRTLRPYLVCPSVNLGKLAWIRANPLTKAETKKSKPGIF